MGRGPHKKEQLKVKSVRLGDNDLNAIKVFMEAEDVPQSDAVRTLLQYGILYYTMYVLDDEKSGS